MMTTEEFYKIKDGEGLNVFMERFLTNHKFGWEKESAINLTVPVMAERLVRVDQYKNDKRNRLEVLTLIPIYNYEKMDGGKVWDYRGTLIYDIRGELFKTQFIRQFISLIQIVDFFEET